MRLIRIFSRNRSGATAIEFALVAPILVLMTLGVVEIARYGMFRQQLAETVSNTVDIVSRLDPARTDQIDGVLDLAGPGLSSYHDARGMRVFASGIDWDGNAPRVAWQRSTGDYSATSAIGDVGGEARVPQGLIDADVPLLVAVEIVVDYTSWISDEIAGHEVRDRAFVRPRNPDD